MSEFGSWGIMWNAKDDPVTDSCDTWLVFETGMLRSERLKYPLLHCSSEVPLNRQEPSLVSTTAQRVCIV